jgi:signal transduction histidine kinase
MTAHNQVQKSGVTPIGSAFGDVLNTHREADSGLHLHLIRVNLAAIVYDAIGTALPGILSRGHRISVSLPPDSVLIAADPVQLKQILTNLLTNAANYTARGGDIYLSADASIEAVTIRVRDNGRGISPEVLPFIFDPFRRPVQARPGGLGLGLSLVKSLVELHGGNVVAKSMGLNMGSEFTITLPACRPDVGVPI